MASLSGFYPLSGSYLAGAKASGNNTIPQLAYYRSGATNLAIPVVLVACLSGSWSNGQIYPIKREWFS